jgi:uncharacterized protein (TIGR03000 family)
MRALSIAALSASLLTVGSDLARGQGIMGPNGYGGSRPGYAGPLDLLATPPGRPFGFGSSSFRYDYPSSFPRSPLPGIYDDLPYSYRSLYPLLADRVPDNRARLRFHLPSAAAEVWLEGKKMTQTGSVRDFYSPPLEPGFKYSYHVRVRWAAEGKTMERSRTIFVRPNTRQEIRFTAPEA